MERVRSLDLFKGVAIIFVIIGHCNWTYSERMKYGFPFWVDMAVPVFMIISGYVYAKSYDKHKISTFEEAWKWENVLDKTVRYTVPFGISYIMEVALRLMNGSYSGLRHSLLVFLEGGDGPGSYYYPIMIQFIFLFPVLYFPIKKNKVKGYLFCVVLNVIYELIFQRVYGMTELYYRMIVFRYIFLIASGILLVYYDGEKTLCHMILCAVTFMTGVAYIYIFRYKAVPLSVFRYWIGTSMLPSLYIVSIIYAGWRYLKKMHFKPLEIIGKASYDIFLIQMVYFLFCDYILRGIESILLQTLVSVIICVVVGVLFYYVERGLTEYLRKRVVMIIHNH